MIFDLIKLVSALGLALYLRQLISSFGFMGLSELRRRAEAGQQAAERVLAARIYGLKLYLVLWFLFALMIVFVVTALDDLLPSRWVSVAGTAFVLIFLISVLPWIKRWSPKLDLAAHASPCFSWFLNKIQIFARPFKIFKLSQRIQTDIVPDIHSKEHLLELMALLKDQTQNSRVLADLDLATLTLTFSSKKIKSLMTPLKKMKKVSARQDITPKLAEELSNSGFAIFPVLRSEEEASGYCGILYIKDIKKLTRTTRAIYQIMHPHVYYVYQDSPLNQVINAFIQTQEHLFFVVNQSRQIVGLISLTDVLEQYIGSRQLDSFHYYDDAQMVVQAFGQNSTQPAQAPQPAKKSAHRSRAKALKKSQAKLKQIQNKARSHRSKRSEKK